jgi:Phosphotransferase enzyme family
VTEEPLPGGNMTGGVVRVGDTVRRPAGPWTPAVHALLDHLRAVGFRGAPRAHGLDDQGREVLDFVPGTVPYDERFGLLDPDDRLHRVGRLIRDFHDAVSDFAPPPDARWQSLVPTDGDEIIAHHDLAPWNLVVGDRWTFIDWDVAGPGTRMGDLAYAMHGFVPLTPSTDPERAGHRVRVLADAYGASPEERRDLLGRLEPRTRVMHDFLRDQAALRNLPWLRHWQEGHGDVWRRDADYIAAHENIWRAALRA